ncbi:MAG: DEAD/DEAH box helicase family protein [Patescibacteria group bacterium]|nr:DEAD/DEAH box helicase family protein [Patescibacteria group bacterium]
MIRPSDLVLKVKAPEPVIERIEKYEAFLSALCGKYYFQKEAAYEVLKFLFSDVYPDTRALASKNFVENEKLVEQYGSEARFLSKLQMPTKRSCSVDLATGTGKSFLIYAIAQIMLAEGLVDRVLVLCPSLTIEAGLQEKFISLTSNRSLKRLLPRAPGIKNPRIINATQTIKYGDICVENIHAVYQNTGSSIYDSLKGHGAKTLVLNDEAHHVFNAGYGEDEVAREWKKFLLNGDIGFKYVVNFTGTPYVGDDYFTDVVYRYGLRQGMDERFIKTVEYRIETGFETKMTSFEEVWKNHRLNCQRYNQVKPISIVVTADIATCIEVWNELIKFIARKEGINFEHASHRAIWVVSGIPAKTSAAGRRIYKIVDKPESVRQRNLGLLKTVDETSSPVEFIVSVAMLTEGWDVKNVFQIVPHSSRAFNSKLLINQVLGRGLRIPEVYAGQNDIKVRICNHIKFGSGIENIVKEILEAEESFACYSDPARSTFRFKLHNIEYLPTYEKTQCKKKKADFSEKIMLVPQSRDIDDYSVYRNPLTGEEVTVQFERKLPAIEITAAAQTISAWLKSHDLETGETDLHSTYTSRKIEKIIRKNLATGGTDFLSMDNFNRVRTAFGKLFDPGDECVVFKNKPDKIVVVDTATLPKKTVSLAALRRDAMTFYTTETKASLTVQEKAVFEKMLGEEEEYKTREVETVRYKCPTNCVTVSHKPEREFMKNVVVRADLFDAFIKNSDQGFYSLPYSYKKGTHMFYGDFSPDFFLKKDRDIMVVEIKMDEEDARESRAKLRCGLEHFQQVNEMQSDQKYYFFFLSPKDYPHFFQAVKDGKHDGWESSLMKSL